ncbi:MAG: nucleotide exchange factor GrpE [Candidatus Atribacteria bacterium]|nr:MAG: nucleotide exchange factor GrpE [Candidatus Atribacteria bacterium]
MSSKKKEHQANEPVQPEATVEPSNESPLGTECENELRATIDRLQRLQAEFENYKKRSLRDASVFRERIGDQIILDFLPLYDNLQRAFMSLSSNHDVETFISGVEQIFAQFQQVLEGKGVTPIGVVNQSFDPSLHEAMLSVESDLEKNKIVEEFMPGYTRDERVLRPSRVSVSQGPALHEENPK